MEPVYRDPSLPTLRHGGLKDFETMSNGLQTSYGKTKRIERINKFQQMEDGSNRWIPAKADKSEVKKDTRFDLFSGRELPQQYIKMGLGDNWRYHPVQYGDKDNRNEDVWKTENLGFPLKQYGFPPVEQILGPIDHGESYVSSSDAVENRIDVDASHSGAVNTQYGWTRDLEMTPAARALLLDPPNNDKAWEDQVGTEKAARGSTPPVRVPSPPEDRTNMPHPWGPPKKLPHGMTVNLVNCEGARGRVHVSTLESRKPDSIHDWPRTDGPLRNRPANGLTVSNIVSEEQRARQESMDQDTDYNTAGRPQSLDTRRHVSGVEHLSTNATARDGSVYSGHWHPRSSIKHQDMGQSSGTKTFPDGSTYTGEWHNNDRNGRGSYTDATRGTKYEGEFKGNMMSGVGLLLSPDGSRYEGQFQNNVRSGIGKMNYSDGSTYEGPFSMDREHGEHAKRVWASGEEYKGEFKQGLREGFGTTTYANGDSYSGGWRTDKRSGKGTMYWREGAGFRYIGFWENGIQCGKGNLTEGAGDDSASYYGQFLRGKPHGKGQKKFADGSVYEGEWVGGLREGQGVYHYFVPAEHGAGVPFHVAPVRVSHFIMDMRPTSSGSPTRPGTTATSGSPTRPGTTATSGSFSPASPGGIAHNKAMGSGEAPVHGVKDTYDGGWTNDKPSGQGVLDMKSTGDTYDGNFAIGQQSGKGVCHYADGSTYEGRWRIGRRDGRGKITYGNGDTYDGEWVRDQRYGKAVMTERRGTISHNVEYSRDRQISSD